MEVIVPEWTYLALAVLAFVLLAVNHWLTRRAHGLRKRQSDADAAAQWKGSRVG